MARDNAHIVFARTSGLIQGSLVVAKPGAGDEYEHHGHACQHIAHIKPFHEFSTLKDNPVELSQCASHHKNLQPDWQRLIGGKLRNETSL